MAGQTTSELVAAVVTTGGLGILGATRTTPDKLLDAVRKIKMLTKPYSVSLWLGPYQTYPCYYVIQCPTQLDRYEKIIYKHP
jgi:NAD(P)H-dependent flavin oxidoreductase YrpB (nitropropane dioxygenase family)